MDVGELMLILKRRRDEKIKLTNLATGEEITLTVVDLNRFSVKLGFDASSNIRIMRTELDDNSENPKGEIVQGETP